MDGCIEQEVGLLSGRLIVLVVSLAFVALGCTEGPSTEMDGATHEVGARPGHIPESAEHVDLVHAAPPPEEIQAATRSMSAPLVSKVEAENDWVLSSPNVYVAEFLVADDSLGDAEQRCVVLVNLDSGSGEEAYASFGCIDSEDESLAVLQDSHALVVGNVTNVALTHALSSDETLYQERHGTMFVFPIDGISESIDLIYSDNSNRITVP